MAEPLVLHLLLCALRAYAKCGAIWQIVRFRAACAGRSRIEISAKMDARMASRIIMMALFSEHAEAAQEPCASRAVFIAVFMARIMTCRFLSLRWCKLTTCGGIFQAELFSRSKHCIIRQKIRLLPGVRLSNPRVYFSDFSLIFRIFPFISFNSLGTSDRLAQFCVSRSVLSVPVFQNPLYTEHTTANPGFYRRKDGFL